jgi:LPS export ABC transporter permease LptF/LPS export ABC transporter permease LptG
MAWLARLRPTLLDRYIAREILPPTGLGLLLFTFIMLLQQVTLLMGILISRGADLPTVVRVFAYLLPSILSVTIPMAFLLGLLLAFGRMASDSEIVALRASGVSPTALLRPVAVLAGLACAVTFWIMAVALPAANQAHREILFSLVVNKTRASLKPRVFADDWLPGQMIVYVSDIPADTGRWKDVFIYDSRVPQKPRAILARGGRLVIDEARKAVELHLQDGTTHVFDAVRPDLYEAQRFRTAELPLPFEQFFPNVTLAKGDREMTLGELAARMAELRAKEPGHRDIPRYAVEWHKKFSIPAACAVFGLLGLGLSLGSKKEARSAAFALSIAVIFIYYVVLRLGEQAGDTGMMPPALAMWGANILLGGVALLLLWLNQHQAAFDPLDPRHYTGWLPRIRRSAAPPPAAPVRAVARPRPRPAVVLRIPRITLRFPGLLDRYIARSYVGHLVLVIAAFASFALLAEFLDLFNEIQDNRVRGKVVFHYFTFRTPFVLHLIAPFGVLLATLTTFGILSRRNEITAMKAGGISVFRAAVAVILLGGAVSLGMLMSGEFLLPFTNRVAEQDLNVIRGRPPQSSSRFEHRWMLGSDDRLYNYEYLVETQSEFSLYGLSVYDISPRQFELRGRLYAARALWNGLTYDLDRGWRRTLGRRPGFEAFDARRTREIDPPEYFKREDKESDQLGFGELLRHIDSLGRKGMDVTKLRVQLHRKLAFPGIALVMTLIGIPFSFVVGRRGALWGVGFSLVMAILLWTVLAIFEALGNNALLPPMLAAWAPNMLFAVAGLYLMLTLET